MGGISGKMHGGLVIVIDVVSFRKIRDSFVASNRSGHQLKRLRPTRRVVDKVDI
jgi:hypothetical protein